MLVQLGQQDILWVLLGVISPASVQSIPILAVMALTQHSDRALPILWVQNPIRSAAESNAKATCSVFVVCPQLDLVVAVHHTILIYWSLEGMNELMQEFMVEAYRRIFDTRESEKHSMHMRCAGPTPMGR